MANCVYSITGEDSVCVLAVISLEVEKESAVDVMADRLCAAVHAFALCCQARTSNTALQ